MRVRSSIIGRREPKKSWQDDLIPVAVAVFAQLGMLRFVDWARANVDVQPIARDWVENSFYYVPRARRFSSSSSSCAFRSLREQSGWSILRSSIVGLSSRGPSSSASTSTSSWP
jgi:hypothetical protein